MTRAELLKRVKRDRPGESTEDELNLWIDQLDEKWRDEVLLTHAGPNMRGIRSVWDYEPERWRGNTGSLSFPGETEGSVTVRADREKGVLRLSGTATEDLCLFINGADLNGEAASEPSSAWDNLDPEGPAFGETQRRLHWTMSHEVPGISILAKVPDTLPAPPGRPRPNLGEYTAAELTGTEGSHLFPEDNTEANTDMILPMALCIPIGTTFPAGFELHLLMTEPEREVLPEDWLRRLLLIPELDDEVYVYWLYSKIDFRLGEMERYNNDATMFNTAWDTAAKRWHRNHMPLGRQQKHVIYGHPVPWRAWEDPLDQRRDWPKW